MDGWTQTLSAGTLLGIAAAAIFADLDFDCKTARSCLADVGIGQPADCHRNRSAYGQHC